MDGDTIHGNDGNDVVLGDNGVVTTVVYESGGLVSVDEISSEVSATDSLGGAGHDVWGWGQ